MMHFLRPTAATFLDGNGLHPASLSCTSRGKEPFSTLSGSGNPGLFSILQVDLDERQCDCRIAMSPAWIMPLPLFSPFRCTAGVPLSVAQTGPVRFCLVYPIFVCMNGKLNLFSWDTPGRCGEGRGEGGKLCGKQSQCTEIKVFNFDAEQILPSSLVFRFCVSMRHIRRPEIAILGLIRR